MAVTEVAPAAMAVVAVPAGHAERSTPFASKDVAAVAAYDQSPFSTSAAQLVAISAPRTPSPGLQQKPLRKVPLSKRLMACACVRPAVSEDVFTSGFDSKCQQGVAVGKGSHWDVSPRKSMLLKQGSAAFTDADWFDARSEFSALSGQASDQAAKLEELSVMIRDLAPAAPHKAPWIPEPPLAFAKPGMRFMPVPAVTGFAAYWERDPLRSTPFPTPIDAMTKASALAQRSHASIPGIWLQETDGNFTVTVKPAFLPPGLPRYTETYDKSNSTELSWPLRRDLRLGSTSGNIYMTTDGVLILRARSRPMFGNVDFIMEEYMHLEEGGKVIVDQMCCLEVRSGNRATQQVVGNHHDVPPKGHV